MAKAKKAEKKPAKPAVTWREFDEAVEIAATRLQGLDNKVEALEEAICPRVAARLNVLERSRELQINEGHAACEAFDDIRGRLAYLERGVNALQDGGVNNALNQDKRITAIEQELKALRIWGGNVTAALVELNKAQTTAAEPGKFYATTTGLKGQEPTGSGECTSPRSPITEAQALKLAKTIAENGQIDWGSLLLSDKVIHLQVAKEVIELVESIRPR